MSLMKAEVKAATAHSIGVRMDDRLEAAQAEMHRFEGASGGVKQAGESIQELMAQFQKEVNDGKLSQFGEQQLKVAEQVTQWLRRAIGSCMALGDMAASNRLKCMGKVEALQQSVKDVMAIHSEEMAKAEALKQGGAEVLVGQVAGGKAPSVHLPGIRPPVSIAAQRKAEEAVAPTPGTAAKAKLPAQAKPQVQSAVVKPQRKGPIPRPAANGGANAIDTRSAPRATSG
jgi:hypothetical protein